jgi:hypothetical protein
MQQDPPIGDATEESIKKYNQELMRAFEKRGISCGLTDVFRK